MSGPDRGPVVIDTGVFGARMMRHSRVLASGYAPLVAGRPAIISFVTMAELEFGARAAGWGVARMRRLGGEVANAEVVWPDVLLVDAYADLRSWCVRNGHGLGQKEHEADRWVAATALNLGLPLVAHDRIFAGIDGLNLITRL
ncbi:MAG: PIN domain-containing protein [Angustibacter sp.]